MTINEIIPWTFFAIAWSVAFTQNVLWNRSIRQFRDINNEWSLLARQQEQTIDKLRRLLHRKEQ